MKAKFTISIRTPKISYPMGRLVVGFPKDSKTFRKAVYTVKDLSYTLYGNSNLA